MAKLSDLIAKLEQRADNKFGKLLSRYKGKIKGYIPLGLCVLYFYGMLVNSVRLGISSTFNASGETTKNIWVVNPISNLLAIFTPTGLAVTAVCFLLFCLITKKGYIWFSDYKYTRDPRGFDILPDATHGSSGFMSQKEMVPVLNIESVAATEGTVIGKLREHPDDDAKYSKYLSIKKGIGLSDNVIKISKRSRQAARERQVSRAVSLEKHEKSISNKRTQKSTKKCYSK